MARETVRIGAATVIRGDCLEVLPGIGPVDAIVTDPPYHLTSGNAGFDWSALGPNGAKRPNIGPTNKLGRGHKTGFMGQRWDGGDIAFRPETWATMLPALNPGGYLLAFGGTRTHHRIWCAIEDAGFVIQDTISWLYGQGFPKGRTQLKPAWEPIVVAYKPGGKRALQIDECRIQHPAGRWPANLCHDGSDEVLTAFAAFGVSSDGIAHKRSNGVGMFRMPGHGHWGGYGGFGSAARFFYCAKAGKADRAGSKHPTVKPIALIRWLVRLVTPPGGTVLDPFAGSGTTGAAALAEGRSVILIEREPEYFEDIKRRLRTDQRRLAKAA